MRKVLLTFTAVLLIHAAAAAQEQYELAEINFEGNSSISSSELQDAILSEETPMWLWQFLNKFTPFGAEPVYFDSSNIDIDISAIETYYKTHGFFEADVSGSFVVDTADNEVVLTYTISEGEPANFNRYQLYGLDSINSELWEEVHENLAIDTTDQYDQEYLQERIDLTVNTLMNSGYMNAVFDSSLVLQDTSLNNADFEIYYTTGRKYFIDTVLVKKQGAGERFVSEGLLRKLTDIHSGELYNLEKINRSQRRLFRAGLFGSVFIRGIDSLIEGNRVPLELNGTIMHMNELSPEIIVNNQQSAFNIGLGANYIRRNFFGDARTLTLRSSFGIQDIFNADFSNLIRRFSFRDTTLLGYVDARVIIEQPFLFGEPIFGIWENYATINKEQFINNTIYGSKITFEFELPQFTFINFLSTYYNVEQNNEIYRNNNDSLSSKLLSIIGADFAKITADDLMYPVHGYNLAFIVEEANSLPHLISKITGGSFNGSLFYKVQFTGSFYFSLNNQSNSILAAKIKSGHLQAYLGDFAGIPYNRTFFAGGSNSVRGWRSNTLRPKELLDQGREKGGTFLLEGALEWRYRFLESFGTAIFADYGNTWLGYEQFRYDELALAFGVGFRYYSPVAPFRIDFGTKFYDPYQKNFIWDRGSFWHNLEFHFGIGEAF